MKDSEPQAAPAFMLTGGAATVSCLGSIGAYITGYRGIRPGSLVGIMSERRIGRSLMNSRRISRRRRGAPPTEVTIPAPYPFEGHEMVYPGHPRLEILQIGTNGLELQIGRSDSADSVVAI